MVRVDFSGVSGMRKSPSIKCFAGSEHNRAAKLVAAYFRASRVHTELLARKDTTMKRLPTIGVIAASLLIGML